MSTTPGRLRVAIVGAGMIGRAHAHALRAMREFFQPVPADVRLTVIADAAAALTSDAQARFEFERVASDWREVVDARDVDVAIVALPNHQHLEPVAALLAAGKHVLCEKPLAPNPTDARVLAEAARRSGLVHGTAFNLRRVPAIAAIQRSVARGDLGELRHFSSTYLADYALSPQTPFTWRYQRALAGGGALVDLGAHSIDLARFLVGDIAWIRGAQLQTFITRRPIPAGHVIGHAKAASTGEFGTVDNDDIASFTVRFANGVIGDFTISRIAAGFPNAPGFRIIGSRGSASFDFSQGPGFQYYDDSVPSEINGSRGVIAGPNHPYLADVAVLPVAGAGYGYTETYVAQAHEFIRAVAQNTPYTPSFEDGLATTLICDAVARSAEEGRAVPVT